ncbi:molybdopterin converting factor subunit 1 [Coralliovum pocilloporae]|uniref:molybdopterin converting factor subunit 1 n=1 Tax=Coralliovum pocilloporae TaxID=3066369 RepID=UPI003306A822
MKLLYFAWIRERIGVGDEEVELPDSVETVADLLSWLRSRDETYAYAFEQAELVRVALDQTHADHADPLGQAREVAFFPPMTGG